MTNKKSTKRSLIMSGLALFICISMFIGSTYAWFTDSVTSSGNKIKAGTLDVQLLMDADVDGTYDDISDSTSPIFGSAGLAQDSTNTLWEPGKTQVAYLAIKNNGNLDLKYTVGLNVQNVSKDLYEVMEYAIVPDANANNKVTAWNGGNSVVVGTQSVSGDVELKVGETHYFALAIHMDELAGNEYQEGEVNFDLTVLATQLASESDSFGNQYDKDATYLNTDADGNYLISNANELVYFAKSVNVDGETYAGKTVKLTADIDLAGKNWIPVGGSGSVASYPNKTFSGTFDGDGKTISNMKVNVTGEFASAGLFGTANRATIKNVKISEADIRSTHYAGAILGYDTETTVISGCSVVNSVIASAAENSTGSWDNGDKVGGIVGYMNIANVSNCSVSNTSIQGYRDIGGIIGYIGGGTVSACTINNVTIYVDNIHNYKNYTTLSEHDANDYVGESHGTVSTCTGTANINSLITVSTASELSAALNKTYTEDTTVMLTKDITLTDEWGKHSLDGKNDANLTINGNGKTIYGLTCENYINKDSAGGFNSNGLVTNIGPGFSSVTFKNLTIDGATLTNEGGDSAATGVFVGNTNTVDVTFDTCTVTGAVVNCYKWAGGFIGFTQDVYNNKSIKLINCVVSDSNINTTDSSVGGLVGHNYTDLTITGCQIKGNTTIKCDENRTDKVAKAGYLIGTVSVGSASISNITVESTVTLDTMGGTTYDTTNYVGRIDGATVNGVTPNS